MKKATILITFLFLLLGMGVQPAQAKNESKFVTIKGENLITPDGKKLYIIGTNLGNWLNPEGYMFNFRKTNCEWMINSMVCTSSLTCTTVLEVKLAPTSTMDSATLGSS